LHFGRAIGAIFHDLEWPIFATSRSYWRLDSFINIFWYLLCHDDFGSNGWNLFCSHPLRVSTQERWVKGLKNYHDHDCSNPSESSRSTNWSIHCKTSCSGRAVIIWDTE
jgi:hypothetical protein